MLLIFIVGLLVGGLVGALTICLFAAGKPSSYNHNRK